MARTPTELLDWDISMNLGLQLWNGVCEEKQDVWLRWCDLDDNLIATGAEKAAQERAIAQQEKARAPRLAAKLRELGVDPDSV